VPVTRVEAISAYVAYRLFLLGLKIIYVAAATLKSAISMCVIKIIVKVYSLW
jgi:hypothetical protein